jgi:hypothetical protein
MTRSRSALRNTPSILTVFIVLVSISGSLGCSTRTVNSKVVGRHGLDIYLRSERAMFGDDVDRDFDQPADVSVERLEHILGSIEIETRESARVSERQHAIHAQIVADVADGVSKALAEAGPGQEIVVMAIRRQMQHGVFDRKYLTSFVVFMRNDRLYVHLSRVDWKIEKHREDNLPMPHVNDREMEFRTVTNDYIHYAGRQGIEVDWRDPVFQKFQRLPGTIGEGQRRKTVLMEDRLPRDAGGDLTTEQLGDLSPAALRELANLEEDRQAGRITEGEYRRNRQQILSREDLD